jgi:hypothetical protein
VKPVFLFRKLCILGIGGRKEFQADIARIFRRKAGTYETTEVTEKDSVSSRIADEKVETWGGGK